MSESKETRPVTAIQEEYSSACARAGHIQYQISALKKDLDMVNSTLRDLNFEAAASARAASEVKPAAEQPKVEEISNG